MLPLLAVAAEKVTPLEKLRNVSGQFWIKVILAFVVLAVVIAVLKWLSGMNRIIMIIIGCVIMGVAGFNWIYERNEPAFLTPIIDPIARSGFFPSKGAYEGKQQQDLTDPSGKKNAPAKPAPTPTQPAKK
jgi:hypothetical protein